MKKICFAFSILCLLVWVATACTEVTPITPDPAATPTPVATVGQASFTYTNSNITITHGQSILWDSTNTGHPLNIDKGSGSCLVSGQTTFPFTCTFSTAGTYHFHCGIHSTCGNGTCPSPFTCTGSMIGTITVN